MATLAALSQALAARIQEQPLPALVITIVIICVTTRLISSQNGASQVNTKLLDAKAPPAVPYWLPYLGHIPQMAFNADGFLAGLRKLHGGGAFTLNFLGSTHTVVFKPGLNTSLVNQNASSVDSGPTATHLMKANFGYPRSKASMERYHKIVPDTLSLYKYLSSEASLNQMVDRTVVRLRHNIADFVTFNSADIDQTHWERLAEASLIEDPGDGVPVVEAEFFELVRNFIAQTANVALLGTDFVENFPDFWQALWRFDRGFFTLMMDLPSILPINKAIGARRARGMALRWLDEFERAMDTYLDGGNPGPQWADLSNVSPLIQERVKTWREHGLTIMERSAFELGLVWAMNANSNPLVFWMLWRIYSDPELLARVRAEIDPYVIIEAPAVGFGGLIGTATRIESINVDALINKCPWLKASYIECLRIDFNAWSFKAVQEDTVISERDDVSEKFFLRAGTYAHGAHELHHTDPNSYPDPHEWRAERHIKWIVNEKGEKVPVADMGSIRPYGKILSVLLELEIGG